MEEKGVILGYLVPSVLLVSDLHVSLWAERDRFLDNQGRSLSHTREILPPHHFVESPFPCSF